MTQRDSEEVGYSIISFNYFQTTVVNHTLGGAYEKNIDTTLLADGAD